MLRRKGEMKRAILMVKKGDSLRKRGNGGWVRVAVTKVGGGLPEQPIARVL
jgi:hypothetical protein